MKKGSKRSLFREKLIKIKHFSWNFQKICLSLHRQIPPASHKNSVPSGTFLYIDMRYTKQAMTLAQQIQTLQSRGLIIADTNKAEQALDAISYFRLADYWYHL